jgi:hypothetical protein
MPVDLKNDAQGARGLVDAVPRNQHDPGSARDARSETPVFGQQDPILSGAALGEGTVGKRAFGNQRVIPGGSQPSAEAAQHLIAEKPWHLVDSKPAMPAVYIITANQNARSELGSRRVGETHEELWVDRLI